MCSHEPNVDHAIGVVDLDDESVVVALDVEDNPAVADDAGAPVFLFDLRWRGPVLLLDLAVPSQEGLLRVGVCFPEFPEGLLGYDPHANLYIVPKSYASTPITYYTTLLTVLMYRRTAFI